MSSHYITVPLVAVSLLLSSTTTNGQRITEDLVVLYDFTEGQGNTVFDRGPSLGVPGDPVDLMFDPNELSGQPIAGEFGDRPGLISWGDTWLNINKDHPADDGIAHGTPDAAVVWAGGPGTASKVVDMIVATGEFTIEAWVRPESIENRSNPGRIVWMTVEGTDDASNFVLGQQSCCDGGGQPGGVQIRLNTDSADAATRVQFNSDGFLFEEGQLVHMVHTHDASLEETRVYLNREGEAFDAAPVIDEFVFGDNLEGWDPDYVLAVGNDPYRFSRWFGGELHLIAIYSRAFSEEEIHQHFDLGPSTDSPLQGDFNGDGQLDALDIDLLTSSVRAMNHPIEFDVTGDGQVDVLDVNEWISAPNIFNSWLGDANLDKQFNTADLVTVLAAGAYEADVDAVWSTGDFNGDGRANTGDLVAALAGGGYEAGPRAAARSVPEPSSLVVLSVILAFAQAKRQQRRR